MPTSSVISSKDEENVEMKMNVGRSSLGSEFTDRIKSRRSPDRTADTTLHLREPAAWSAERREGERRGNASAAGSTGPAAKLEHGESNAKNQECARRRHQQIREDSLHGFAGRSGRAGSGPVPVLRL